MSYQVAFKGYFRYPNTPLLEEALKVIDQEEAAPDYEEMNPFFKSDFKIGEDLLVLRINYDSFIPATAWYGGIRVFAKMSTHARSGAVVGSYEGEEAEWIGAGDGWD